MSQPKPLLAATANSKQKMLSFMRGGNKSFCDNVQRALPGHSLTPKLGSRLVQKELSPFRPVCLQDRTLDPLTVQTQWIGVLGDHRIQEATIHQNKTQQLSTKGLKIIPMTGSRLIPGIGAGMPGPTAGPGPIRILTTFFPREMNLQMKFIT